MASLLELVETLVRDPAAKAAYSADPDEFLDHHGFGGLEPADLEEALHHAADSFPPTVAAQVDPAAGFDSLVHVDLQELGFDDELRPLDPLDDDPVDTADWNGPRLGDDVDFDAPPGAGGQGADGDAGGGQDAPVDHGDLAADLDGATDAPAAGLDGDVDEVLAPSGGDAPDAFGGDAGTDGDGPGEDELGVDTLVDQPATADWAEDGFDRPGLGPDSDDPWFYNQDEPSFELPEQVDDDIMDDVDDFHHDG